MTRTLIRSLQRRQLTLEAADWVTLRIKHPTIQPDAVELLARSAEPRRGNMRFTFDGQLAYELGDLRGLMPSQAEQYFLAQGPPVEITPSEVACVLCETGATWTQPSNDGDPWKSVVRGWACAATYVPGGVQVSSQLAHWDGPLDSLAREAVALFLIRAHAQLRLVRFTLQDHEVSVVSFAAADRLDIELPDSVPAVVAACQLIAREVQALTNDAMARAYLEGIR